MVTLLMALTTKKIQQYISKRFNEQQWKNFIEGIELILCYFEWRRKHNFWKLGDHKDKNNTHFSIKIMMLQLNRLLPRKDGSGWNITKVHELLHIADDIEHFGALDNTNTSLQEKNHIYNNKTPATTAQK